MSKIDREGISLAYAEAGTGDPPLVLLHGLMNDRSYVAAQQEHFSASHRTVAVDLRGHGESEAPEQRYTIPGFADDVLWLIEQLQVRRPVLVGHSMGGATALEAAASAPDVVSGVVILDSPIVPPPDFGAAMAQLAEGARSPAYPDVIRQFMSQFVGFREEPARAERMVEEMAATPQHVTADCLQAYVDWDSAAAAAAVKVPVLYVSSGPWFTEVDRFRAACPQLITGQTVGSGHYHQLEVADQVNAMIERFLRTACVA